MKREKDIARAMSLVWESLESHLPDVYDPVSKKVKEKIAKEHIGGKKFHCKCVKEYAFIIKVLADLL